MKVILFIFFLLVPSLIGYAGPIDVNLKIVQWSKNLLGEKNTDTTEFNAFADTCIKYGKTTQLINTYRSITDAGGKDIQVSDLRFFNALCQKIDTTHPTVNDFYTCYYISRIYIIHHMDDVLPLRYASMAVTIGKKLNDDRLLLRGYYVLTSYYTNIKHDLLHSYENIEEMDWVTRRSKIDFIKEGNIDVNVRYAVVYYYLEDYERAIEYINKSVAEAKRLHKYEQLFDLYKRRSYNEMEMGDLRRVLRTIDSASIIAAMLPNSAKFQNYIQALRFNVYEKFGDYELASAISRSVIVDNLKGDNDDYYDYLYHLVRLYLHEKKYALAIQYIDTYMASLKAWNLQRLENGYELKYKLNKETNHPAEALKYYEAYILYDDSVHHQKNNAALFREQLKYQTLQKDEALKLERAENKIKMQTIRFIIVGSVTIVLWLLLLLAYRINGSLKEKERLNRSFAQQLIQNTEYEQNRLANELHDGLGQELLLLKNSLAQQGEDGDADKVAGIIESVRSIARELYPALLDVVGLKAAIENQLNKIDQTEKIFVASELEYEGEIDKNSQLQLYRIFQEAVTNILKYASATSMYVGLTEANGKIKLEIKDNGVGFNVTEKINSGESFGLVSMQKRADAIHGILKINSSANGTEITITIQKDENSNS
ncbi:MAG: sensor histidine kinase [Flavipsychrobacter sp.]|nr:sensor histidine kinase [Flavipsychrobacter sp.]